MNYKAFYRTYRPTVFSEVVGQDHIVKTLVNIVKHNKISHGYLFSGPRGTGKTSVAKIFANAINCIHSEKPEDICKHCLETRNTSMDVIEIDAASNNGVNDVRTLRENVNLAPINHPYKIYIIDEVHMLSKGAFNALLTTLEEPPAHVIFILATTDPEKIPETILSRVQRYNFKRITKKDLVKQLEFVFKKENIQYDSESLDMIASLANGSLRDALSIADQISAYSNGNITNENVIEIFGLSTIESQVKLLNLCTGKNVSQALNYFESMINGGVDVSKLIVSLINLLKDYLIYKKTSNSNIVENPSSIPYLDQLHLKSDNVYKLLDILIPLLSEIKYSDIVHQLAQLAIIKMASIEGRLDDFSNDNQNIIHSLEEKKSFSINDNQNVPLKDVTNDFFKKTNNANEQAKTILVEAPTTERVKTLEKTILSDYSEEEIAKHFNEVLSSTQRMIVDNSAPIENTNKTQEKDIKSKTEEAIFFSNTSEFDVNDDSSDESDEFSFSNPTMTTTSPISLMGESDTDELINKTTEILNFDNEQYGGESEVEESLINPMHDTSKNKFYDTNEIELDSTSTYSFENEMTKTSNIFDDSKTKEFKLLDDSTKAIDLSEGIPSVTANNNVEQQSEAYELTQPNIVNLFVLANKTTFELFKERLLNASLDTEEKFEAYSMIFKELKFICSANDFVLVSSNEDWIIGDLNTHSANPNFKLFINKYFGDNVHFFGITKKEYANSRELLIELKKNNNVPKSKPLKLISNSSTQTMPINTMDKNDVETRTRAIFGDKFKRR